MTRALLVALALLVILLPSSARAAEPRPWDAPRVAEHETRVPAPPPEYLPEDQGWIRFSYHPAARDRVRTLASRATAIRAELSALLGRDVLSSVDVRVAAVPGELGRLSPIPVPAQATVMTFSDLHLVVMSLASPVSLDPPDAEELLRHALAHLALDEASGQKPTPRWLQEGFAVRFSGERGTERAESLCRAELTDRVLSLLEIDARLGTDAPDVSLAHAEAADFARFLITGDNRARFASLVGRLHSGEPFETALPAAYDADATRLELVWRKDMAKRYSFLPVLGGATALWILVAAVVLVRRSRRRKANVLARRSARADLVALRARAVPRAEPAAPREDVIEHFPPDPEVPKVEHDGRWYTLH